MANYAILILILPLVAFVIQIFLGKRLPRNGDWVSTGAIFISLLLSAIIFAKLFLAHNSNFSERYSYDWIKIGSSAIPLGLLIDNITAVMLMVVTIVSSFVHLYSIGYMHGDPRYSRFFAYLSLFSFSMLGLVLTDNLFVLYIFWELVGICSYLLIGFWFEKESAANACKKAFLTTRVGDICMFIGLMILFSQIGSLSFGDVFEAVKMDKIGGGLLTAAGILIFFGAVGKSAQFPLHTWLPDAMEGPTPVSALIHAATMVAAGVYLTARVFPILTPNASIFIAYIGGFTAIFAATIAIVRENIKRVLAYSTISQLGYMMLGLGVGSYVAGLFHLTTHAFFKALLFLGSGSVIHAVHTEDMRLMGGLKNKMPITFWTFLIATLSISGVPFIFSGFWSKDAILGATLAFVMEHPQHILLFLMSACAAGITAFYMFRLLFMTFFGEPKEHHRYEEAHESPANMTIALVVLAILSFPIANKWWFEGLVKNPPRLAYHMSAAEKSPVEKVRGEHQEEQKEHLAHLAHLAHRIAMVLSIIIAALGIWLAAMTYYWKRISAEEWGEKLKPLYTILWNKYYVDEFYEGVIVKGIFMRISKVSGWFDLKVIDGIVNTVGKLGVLFSKVSGWIDNTFVDGLVNGVSAITWNAGSRLRGVQTGSLQNYLLVIFIGVILLIIIFRAI